MALLCRRDLNELMQEDAGLAVSLYMPTNRTAVEFREERTRLRNLVEQAEAQLMESGLRRPEAEDLLRPVRDLDTNSYFWRHLSDGLAVFRSATRFSEFRIPVRLEPLTVVSRHFHIKPIIPFLCESGRYYLLTLSKGGIRLYQGTPSGLDGIELSDVPKSLQDLLTFDVFQSTLQFHTGTSSPGVPGRRQAMYFGQGGEGGEQEKEQILRYFHEVDVGVREMIAGENAPLVLAGVEYLLPIYRQTNEYPHLLEKDIPLSTEQWDEAELHERVWEIVHPYMHQDREDDANRWRILSGRNDSLASTSIYDIVPAAYFERVEALFVASAQQQWGTFDPVSQRVDVHERRQRGDDDLLNLAAIHTLRNNGRVHVVPSTEMPGGSTAAALFRY